MASKFIVKIDKMIENWPLFAPFRFLSTSDSIHSRKKFFVDNTDKVVKEEHQISNPSVPELPNFSSPICVWMKFLCASVNRAKSQSP
jgi:hypothetical protein